MASPFAVLPKIIVWLVALTATFTHPLQAEETEAAKSPLEIPSQWGQPHLNLEIDVAPWQGQPAAITSPVENNTPSAPFNPTLLNETPAWEFSTIEELANSNDVPALAAAVTPSPQKEIPDPTPVSEYAIFIVLGLVLAVGFFIWRELDWNFPSSM